MKRRVLALFAVFVLVLPFSGGERAKAGPSYETYYDVRYNCIFGPPPPDESLGFWTEDCWGNLTGSGWEPGHACTYTIVSYGQPCYLQ